MILDFYKEAMICLMFRVFKWSTEWAYVVFSLIVKPLQQIVSSLLHHMI